MSKYCSNCGKPLKENAEVCLNCGVFVNGGSKSVKQKVKVPGKGMSIASMVIGIVSAIFSLDLIESLEKYYDSYIGYAEIFSSIILYLGAAITGLVLAIVSRKKVKNGFNTSGLVLGIISTILISICLIILIFFESFFGEILI